MNLAKVSGLTEAQLDARAADFFVTRVAGAKATGSVEVFFNSPISLAIPTGAVFKTSSGKKFIATRAHHTTPSIMSARVSRYPLYGTGLIAITADQEGVENEAASGEINEIVGLAVTPVLVANALPLLGGLAKDTNEQLKTRIIDAGTNQTITSSDSIKKVLRQNYPQIKTIVVKGPGDAEMARDLYYSGSQWQNLNTSDFYGKISGFVEAPYNKSIGYYDAFADNSGTEGFEADLPLLGAFTQEFPTTKYVNMYKDDASRALIETNEVLAQVDDITGWDQSDSQEGFGVKITNNEIEYDTTKSMTRLGSSGVTTWYRISDADKARMLAILDEAALLPPRPPREEL